MTPLRAGLGVVAAAVALLVSAVPASAVAPREVLKGRPFAPGDPSLFSTAVYPDSSPMAPAAGDEPTEEEVAAELAAYEKQQFPGDAASQEAVINLFSNPETADKVPSPSLRAALVALRGTLAEPAINYVLNRQTTQGNDEVTTVRFAPPAQMPDQLAIGAVYGAGTADSDQVEIRFNDRYRGEDPFLFAPVMAHEALHLGDQANSNTEEQVSTSFDGLVALGELARHPQLARRGTELARRINTRALARLNSGRGATLGLYATNGGAQLYPGSSVATATSWFEDTGGNAAPVSTPGFSLLGRYLDNIHTPDTPLCSSAQFSKSLLNCINDDGDGGLSPKALLAAAHAMKLQTNAAAAACRSAREGLTAAKKRLSRLRRDDASRRAIRKAKRRVRRARAKVSRACAG